MPDGLYEYEVLAWSQYQAELLRRAGRGERMNDVDWAHVAEEIEDVGLSELHAVESFLNQIMLHLLKLHSWPENQMRGHWRSETVGFQNNLKRRFSPLMRQIIDVDVLYADAVKQLRAGDCATQFPAENPFTLDHLLKDDLDRLLSRFPSTGSDFDAGA